MRGLCGHWRKPPLPVLAQVLGKSPEDLQRDLEKAGLPVDSDSQSLQDLVGTDLKQQVRALNRLLPGAEH